MDLKQYLKDLEYLVNIDSGSKDGFAGLDQIADFFKDRFEGLGWQTEKHDLSPNAGPCLICTNRKAEKYDLLMIDISTLCFPSALRLSVPSVMMILTLTVRARPT